MWLLGVATVLAGAGIGYVLGRIDGELEALKAQRLALDATRLTDEANERLLDAEPVIQIWKKQADACNKRRRK